MPKKGPARWRCSWTKDQRRTTKKGASNLAGALRIGTGQAAAPWDGLRHRVSWVIAWGLPVSDSYHVL